MDDLGGRFWLWLIGIAIAIAVGGAAILLLIGTAWYAWGLLGTLVAIGVVAIAISYVQDRRASR